MKEAILTCQNISFYYPQQPKNTQSNGISDIEFTLYQGETLGLVGESGSGKSTIANVICRFLTPSKGEILLQEVPISEINDKEFYRQVQYIPQHPQQFLHPRRKIYQTLEEVVLNYQLVPKEECRMFIIEMLQSVGLHESILMQYPGELSGGECQRVCIARALLLKPTILVCDEITSALDVTIQKEIIDLLLRLKKQMHMTCLFISHDIALVSQICEHIHVLRYGQTVETGTTEQIVRYPQHDYTQLLIQQAQ